VESKKNFDSNTPVERNGEMPGFLAVHLQRWPTATSPQTAMLKEQYVETRGAEKPMKR